MISRRPLLAGGLAAGGVAVLAGPAGASPARARPIAAATPISRLDLAWWRMRHEAALRRLASGPADLLFLGDSITQDFERPDMMPVWQRFYAPRHAVNLGFGGDATSHLLWRVQNGELARVSPRAAVLLIGANNFGHPHWPADETVAGIEAILDEVRRRLPATRVLLLGVLPSVRNSWVDAQTRETNTTLAARYATGADERVAWLDLSAVFLDGSGRVDPMRFRDHEKTPPDPPLHPSAASHERMALAMEPVLGRWLGGRI